MKRNVRFLGIVVLVAIMGSGSLGTILAIRKWLGAGMTKARLRRKERLGTERSQGRIRINKERIWLTNPL